MKKQLLHRAALLLLAFAIFSLAGCGQQQPSTLEDYLANDEEARQEIKEAMTIKTEDDKDVDLIYDGNNITITCTEKETYDEELLDGIRLAYDAQREDLEDTVRDTIDQIESSTGIDGVSVDIIVKNGDGTEIWKNHYTSLK